jgi:hypothetical protein
MAGGTGRGPNRADLGLRIGVVIVSGGGVRRRSREAVRRPKLVQFTLTLEEFDEVSQAAERAGMARGAYAADVTLATARGVPDRTSSPLREVLALAFHRGLAVERRADMEKCS